MFRKQYWDITIVSQDMPHRSDRLRQLGRATTQTEHVQSWRQLPTRRKIDEIVVREWPHRDDCLRLSSRLERLGTLLAVYGSLKICTTVSRAPDLRVRQWIAWRAIIRQECSCLPIWQVKCVNFGPGHQSNKATGWDFVHVAAHRSPINLGQGAEQEGRPEILTE